VPGTCRVTVTHPLGATVFGLNGVLDAATAPEVRAMLAAAVGETKVILDLTHVSDLDPEGSEIIRDVIGCVHEQGGRVAISRPWRLARALLGLVDTGGFVFLSLSPAGAIAWLNQPSDSRLHEAAFD
jgi:anti-anti-sigma regulatory factor